MKTINVKSTKPALDNLRKRLNREGGRELSQAITKVYNNIKGKEFEELTVDTYTGTQVNGLQLRACIAHINGIAVYQEVEKFDIPEIVTTEAEECCEIKKYSEMSITELTNVLFKDMGTELSTQITNLTTGLKVKLDLLDELKTTLVQKYPQIRLELLETKLANAMAVVKLEKGSSLHTEDGVLSLYRYLATEKKVDYSNFEFLAKIGTDKTKALDILILQSAWKSYKELIANGSLPATDSELNIVIVKAINGIKPVPQSAKDGINNLTFN